MVSHVPDTTSADRSRVGRSRWLLCLAILSSAVVAILSSALIASFFVGDSSRTAVPSGGAAQATAAPLTIALARTPGGSLEWRTYARAIARMEVAVGRPIRLRYVESPSEMAQLLVSGTVDAGFLCTYCYLQVAGKPGVSLVAVPKIAGKTKDAAVLVVRSTSEYGSLADLRGHRVGVVERTSVAGYAYLLWLAGREGVDTHSLVLVPGDSQEQNIRALLARDVEATVVNRSQLASWDGSRLRVIAVSPEFGMPPFVAGRTLDSATRDLMQHALLTMQPSSETTPSSIDGFTKPKDHDYDFARTLETYATKVEGIE